MVNKILGYVIAVIGVLVLALSYPAFRTPLGISSLGIADSIVMIAGLVIAIIGVFLSYNKSSGKQAEEVPIYEGEGKSRRIVGYRKMGKK